MAVNEQQRELSYRKLKSRKPMDIVSVKIDVPAFLLGDVTKYGQLGLTVRERLLRSHRGRFVSDLRVQIAHIAQQISLLEEWRDSGPVHEEGEIDMQHLQLLEIYKDIYFRLKGSKVMRMHRKE